MPTVRSERLFTFRSGGWVLLLAGVVTLVGTVWNLAPLFDRSRVRPRGDGRTTASYDFDLASALVPKSQIVSGGMVADALPPLVDPKTLTLAQLSGLETVVQGRYLVPSDKVVGVVVNGAARAYPLRVLVWHEVVNDTVGGVPILVTYSPLSHGIVAFDRRVSGRTLTFGVSGLLYQSNLLMYDRGATHASESLWSQLQARAVSGPGAAAAATLTPFPFALARWDDWQTARPETTVLAPVEGDGAKYGQDVYGTYFNSSELRFPVDPLPPAGSLPAKTRVFVTGAPGSWTVTPLTVHDDESRFEVVGPSGTVPATGFYAFWFAWYATHRDDPGRVAPASVSR
jgi:Protein of unknown function (DUF3179)